MPQKPVTVPDFRREKRLVKKGLWPVAGIDEVGRGCLAGPVAAAAVILDPANVPKGLNDSKCLPAAVREALYEEILTRALGVSIAFMSAADIDRINIRQASLSAMRRALAGLALVPRYVLIDGNDLPQDLACPGETIISGDALCVSISAASIVAKVARDRLMARLCRSHPAYGFSRHVGYATQEHLAAIAQHGPSPYHRMTFSPLRAG
ncbi:MAG: ribonuclease HII [Methylovirgula sp.]